MKCPKCGIEMEDKGAISKEEDISGREGFIHLYQCPKCHNVEIG